MVNWLLYLLRNSWFPHLRTSPKFMPPTVCASQMLRKSSSVRAMRKSPVWGCLGMKPQRRGAARVITLVAYLVIYFFSGWWYAYPSGLYEFVSWDCDIPNIWKNKIHVPYHQPLCLSSGFKTGKHTYVWLQLSSQLTWTKHPTASLIDFNRFQSISSTGIGHRVPHNVTLK